MNFPMSRRPRFFVGEPLIRTGDYVLDRSESHHAVGVLRCREGDAATLFDGFGGWAEASFVKADAGVATFRAGKPEMEPSLRPRVAIAAAMPKGKRWRTLVEKCTELGAERIFPLLSARSLVRAEGDQARWLRWSIEAAKQCLRARLPEICEPLELVDLLERSGNGEERLFLADPGGAPPLEMRDSLAKTEEAVFIVGPEGGFTDGEADLCRQAGAVCVCLSPFVLRVETAAAAALAVARALSL